MMTFIRVMNKNRFDTSEMHCASGTATAYLPRSRSRDAVRTMTPRLKSRDRIVSSAELGIRHQEGAFISRVQVSSGMRRRE